MTTSAGRVHHVTEGCKNIVFRHLCGPHASTNKYRILNVGCLHVCTISPENENHGQLFIPLKVLRIFHAVDWFYY